MENISWHSIGKAAAILAMFLAAFLAILYVFPALAELVEAILVIGCIIIILNLLSDG